MTEDEIDRVWLAQGGANMCGLSWFRSAAIALLEAARATAPSDETITALKFIKVLVCGDSAPRWTNAHQTTISRGMIADIVDKAIAASAPRDVSNT